MNLKKAFYKIYNDKIIYKINDNSLFSWLCEKIFNVEGKLPKNQKEYLSYLAINGVDVSLPNFDKDLNSISKDFIMII